MSEPTDREIQFSVEGHLFSFNIEELCEASEYFRAMFSGNFRESQENTIVLKEIDVKMFSIFHKWMTVKDEKFSLEDLETDELSQFIQLAERLFVEKLMHFCNQEVVYRRLQNIAERLDEYEWKDQFSKSQAVKLYCQFIEAEALTVELKDHCVALLFSKCFTISPKESIENLEHTKRRMTNLTEVELITDISAALSETASREVTKMLYGLAEEALQIIEEQIKLKKKRRDSATEAMQEYFRRKVQRTASNNWSNFCPGRLKTIF